jgi:hypothetical protein
MITLEQGILNCQKKRLDPYQPVWKYSPATKNQDIWFREISNLCLVLLDNRCPVVSTTRLCSQERADDSAYLH